MGRELSKKKKKIEGQMGEEPTREEAAVSAVCPC